jgi:8-oxo-dGTP diphosphatase
MEVKRFVIRVYGFIHSGMKEVLIAEEFHYNTFMRKFPGGGLDFGEGTVDCLRREIREELNVHAEIGDHLHTTDVFVQSAFNGEHQVMGIYYLVEAPSALLTRYRDSYALPQMNGEERFRWVAVSDLENEEFTFPVDQMAVKAFLKLTNR